MMFLSVTLLIKEEGADVDEAEGMGGAAIPDRLDRTVPRFV